MKHKKILIGLAVVLVAAGAIFGFGAIRKR